MKMDDIFATMIGELFLLLPILGMIGIIVIGAFVIIGLNIRRNLKSNGMKNMMETKVKLAECDNSDGTNIKKTTAVTAENNTEVNSNSRGGNNKRQKNKKRPKFQQFTHTWMVGALKGHTGSVLDMDFSSNGKFLASCAEDRTVHIWCTKDILSKERKSLRINIDYDYATHVRVSPDGKAFIIHKSLGNHVEVYRLKKKANGFFVSATSVLAFSKHHEEDIVGMDIACNGRFIITCSKTNDLIVWDLKGEAIATVDTYLGSTHQAKISPCGRFIAASGFTPDVKVWEVGFTKAGDFKQVSKAFDLTGHSSGIYDFDFCADSSLMASVSKDGTYRFYDTKIEFEKGEDPRLLISGQWENVTPTKLILSPNGEVLVIAHGTSLSFYLTINGELDTTIEDNGVVSCMKFDASGEFLLVAIDKQIRIFRNVTGYRAAIVSAYCKLEQRQTSATKERLEKIIADSMKFLKAMGEHIPQ